MNGFNNRIEEGTNREFYSIIDFYEAEDSECPELEGSKSNSLVYNVI